MDRPKRSQKAGQIRESSPKKHGNATAVSFTLSQDRRRLRWNTNDVNLERPPEAALASSSHTHLEDLPLPGDPPELNDNLFAAQLEFEDAYVGNQDGVDDREEDEAPRGNGNTGGGDGGERIYIDPRDVRKNKYAASVRPFPSAFCIVLL